MNDQTKALMLDPEGVVSGFPSLGAGVDHEWAVEHNHEGLYPVAFYLAASESDAANLTRGTYRVLLTKGQGIRVARKVKSWLFTMLYRQFLGRRHVRCLPVTPIESAECELPTITLQQMGAFDGSLVLTAIQQRDENYRAPVAMFYLEALSSKKMAEVLKLPFGTIMSRISRGEGNAPPPTARTVVERRSQSIIARQGSPYRIKVTRIWNIQPYPSLSPQEKKHDNIKNLPPFIRPRAR